MDNQIILEVDYDGKFLRYIPKRVGHTGKGKRHLAITVLIYNSKNQVLLQKRKHKIFDNIWDFTGATHPLHLEKGDETVEEATWRCLNSEFGIKEKIALKNLGFFNYFAQYGKFCENEHCAMMTGEYNGSVNLNPEMGYEYKWMEEQEFLNDVEQNPKNYAPWVIEGLKVLKKDKNFKI